MKYENMAFEKERALYNISSSSIINCKFEGKEDGESPLKECKDIKVIDSYFNLRYPFWHCFNAKITNTTFKENSRAPFWYCNNITFENVNSNCIKSIRESKNIIINNSEFISEEFCWKSNKIRIQNSSFNGHYFMFNSNDLVMINSTLKGKYSFQYMKNIRIEDSDLDTKDAFWHSKDVVVINSVLKGEYIGWYSKNLTLINCKIIGTQPFCYCDNLKLINCEMIDADFAFENSKVNATLIGKLISIKNPIKGKILVDHVDEIIMDEYKKAGKVKIITKGKGLN